MLDYSYVMSFLLVLLIIFESVIPGELDEPGAPASAASAAKKRKRARKKMKAKLSNKPTDFQVCSRVH